MTTTRTRIRIASVRLKADPFPFSSTLRASIRAMKDLSWSMLHQPWTDEERLAFRWALDHVRAGRTDLAAEDLAWLGARL